MRVGDLCAARSGVEPEEDCSRLCRNIVRFQPVGDFGAEVDVTLTVKQQPAALSQEGTNSSGRTPRRELKVGSSSPHPADSRNTEPGPYQFGFGGVVSVNSMPQVEIILFIILIIQMCVNGQDPASKVVSDRYAVYWNRTNPRFYRGDYHIDVCINDYLDVYCPHYIGPVSDDRAERYILYMVNYDGYSSCDHTAKGFKRWECNRPLSPNGPLKFSEKFQLFTPFSLGFEFRPGREYYYISSITDDKGRRSCLRLKIFVRPQNNCVKNSGSVQEGVDFDDNSHNSLEPRDGIGHESPEPSRRDVNSVSRCQTSAVVLSSALTLLAALLSL